MDTPGDIIARRPLRMLVIAILAAGGAAGPCLAGAEREQNEQEATYLIIARGTSLPQFCSRIYPGATHGLGFGSAGFQIYYTRSRCYFDVAVKTGDARLCDQVHTRSTLFLDGSGISRSECLKGVGGRKPGPKSEPNVDFIFAKPILTQMGYTEAMIPPRLLGAVNEEQMWLDFLNSIAATPDFTKRIDRLPDYTNVASYHNTRTCDRPFLLTPQSYPPPDDMGCCMDINRNGVCDKQEFKNDHVSEKDIVLEYTPGRPPLRLCTDRPFDVEIVVHNRGLWPIRPGVGWVELVPVNPAAFGLTAADFYKPLPEIPPGGSDTAVFNGLRYSPSLGREDNGYRLRANVCLPGALSGCANGIDLPVGREREDASPCLVERLLRTSSIPCRAPYVPDPNLAERGDRACCLDADRDGRCDDREWEHSRARFEAVQVRFPKEGPGLVARAGEPFAVPFTIRNLGDRPLDGRDGLVHLLIHHPRLTAASESDRFVPLPRLEPGTESVVTIRGLRFLPTRDELPSQGTTLEAVLCMRGGCDRGDAAVVTLLTADSEAKLAALAKPKPASATGRRPGDGGRVWSYAAANVRVPSTLDPRAAAVISQTAPDFSVLDADGGFFRLLLLREKKNALLLFYPDVGSPSCHERLGSIQTRLADLARLDVQVLLLSGGSAEELTALRRRLGLDFQALQDVGLRISACYARPAEGERGTPRPMLVLVDKAGIVRLKVIDEGTARLATDDLVESIRGIQSPAAN